MYHNGSVNGYAAYKVANNVKKHYAVGLGIYNVFIYTGGTLGENGQPGTLGDGKTVSISMDNAIEVPNNKDVLLKMLVFKHLLMKMELYKNLILLLMVLVQV